MSIFIKYIAITQINENHNFILKNVWFDFMARFGIDALKNVNCRVILKKLNLLISHFQCLKGSFMRWHTRASCGSEFALEGQTGERNFQCDSHLSKSAFLRESLPPFRHQISLCCLFIWNKIITVLFLMCTNILYYFDVKVAGVPKTLANAIEQYSANITAYHEH